MCSLEIWSGDKLSNFNKQIAEAEKALKEAHGLNISDNNISMCAALEKKLGELHEKQKAYWYLTSRSSEIKDGDRTTKYFHHKASQRKRRNEIKGLTNKSDRWWCTEEVKFGAIIQDYYEELFTSSSPSNDAFNKVLEAVPNSITQEDNDFLLHPFSKEEIYRTICEMHPCKAPGPDDFHTVFNQIFWHIIGDDVTRYMSSLLNGIISPEPLNRINIVLIPKLKSSKLMSEFRSISLCNVLYKIMLKLIVIRKSIRPRVISENQSAFIPGRLITGNALIALEFFHTIRKGKKVASKLLL
ncbi:hypothetical protein AgCh_000814 [Apium graveolens]